MTRRFLAICLMLLSLSWTTLAADVTIAWDASISPGVTGHKVFKGTSAGVYDTPTIIGNQLTYTFTGLEPGTYFFAVKCFDANGNESGFATAQADPTKQYVSTTIFGAVTLSGPPNTTGTAGLAYSGALTASGGKTPYTFSVSAGTLPPGLNLNATTGIISGTPSAAGTFNVTLRVADSQSTPSISTVVKVFTINLAPPTGIKITSMSAAVNWYGVVLMASTNVKGSAILKYQKIAPGTGWTTIIATVPENMKTQHRAVIYFPKGDNSYYNYEWQVADAKGTIVTNNGTFQSR